LRINQLYASYFIFFDSGPRALLGELLEKIDIETGQPGFVHQQLRWFELEFRLR